MPETISDSKVVEKLLLANDDGRLETDPSILDRLADILADKVVQRLQEKGLVGEAQSPLWGSPAASTVSDAPWPYGPQFTPEVEKIQSATAKAPGQANEESGQSQSSAAQQTEMIPGFSEEVRLVSKELAAGLTTAEMENFMQSCKWNISCNHAIMQMFSKAAKPRPPAPSRGAAAEGKVCTSIHI